EDRETLLSLMHGRDWVWITGNHDPGPPAGLGGDVTEELVEGGLVLRHEPLVEYKPGEISGHLHPQATLVRQGRAVRRSCFAASRDRMIMPSFGAYTGGLDVFHPAFDGLFDGRAFHALMRGKGQVYRIAGKDLG
ncbi:MAG: phosphoesterase, partial [Pseudomonadota bacterium]